jgi:DNA-binding transcriptional LysR family regulator
MSLSTRLLEYFVAVGEELHFGRAAERLVISQPALSRQIAALERQLGVALLVRTSRQVRLTAAGQLLLDESRRVLHHLDWLADVTRQAGRGEVGALRVGFLPSAMVGIVPSILATFRATCPRVQMVLEELLDDEQLRRLADGELDVGFTRSLPADATLAGETLVTESWVAVLPSDHRLAHEAAIGLAALADEALLLWPRSSAADTYDDVIAACRQAGFTPRVAPAPPATSVVLLLGMVAAGLGVSILADSYRGLRHDGVTYVPLSGPAPTRLLMIWRRGRLSACGARLLDVARAAAGSRP